MTQYPILSVPCARTLIDNSSNNPPSLDYSVIDPKLPFQQPFPKRERILITGQSLDLNGPQATIGTNCLGWTFQMVQPHSSQLQLYQEVI